MPGKRSAGLLLSGAVSVALLLLLMRGVPWGDVAGSVARASRPGLALYAAVTVAALWLRALRFRVLLAPPRPGTGPLFLATAVQNCLGDLVPARLASFGSWVWLLVRRLAVAPEPAAATFLVSFVLDFATLGPLLALAVLMRLDAAAGILPAGFGVGWVAALGGALFAASALVILALGPAARAAAGTLGGATAASSRRRALAVRLEALAAALDGTRRAGTLLPAFALSAGIRLAKYVALAALMSALLDGLGVATARPGFWDLIIGISATEIVASLPIPALGQFGVWEGGLVGSFVLLGFERGPATIVAVGIHAITQAFEYALGALALGVIAATKRAARD